MSHGATFEEWLRLLDEEIIQGEYGYERGEFTVYPGQWRHMFKEGLTPEQAFRRALDAHAERRDAHERARLENWARVQAAEAARKARGQP